MCNKLTRKKEAYHNKKNKTTRKKETHCNQKNKTKKTITITEQFTKTTRIEIETETSISQS